MGKRKETKYIALCNFGIYHDDKAISEIIKIVNNHIECKDIDLDDTIIPTIEMRAYNSKKDFEKDDIYKHHYPKNCSQHMTTSSDIFGRWKVYILQDVVAKNIIIFSVSFSEPKGYIKRYIVDNIKDDVFSSIEHFVQDYTVIKNIDYEIDKSNLCNTSNWVYEILKSTDKWK